MVRNTGGQSLNAVAIYQDDIERLTVKSSVDEGHVEPEELHNRFAHEQREGTDESLGHDVLPPGRSVRLLWSFVLQRI